MKRANFLIIVAIVAMITACNPDQPKSQQQLIGTWSEPYNVKDAVKEFTFNEDGSLIYINKHDSTWTGPVQQWAPTYANLFFSLTDDEKLCISGRGRSIDTEEKTVDSIPFTFITDYSIKGNKLTIDSFSYDGGLETIFYKSLQLEKR